MAIWLRRAGIDGASDIAATAGIVPARTFAAMMRIDECYRRLEADCPGARKGAGAAAGLVDRLDLPEPLGILRTRQADRQVPAGAGSTADGAGRKELDLDGGLRHRAGR